MRLMEIAKLIRSKNAGPLHLTLDLMFSGEADFRRAVSSPNLKSEAVARRYRVDPSTVSVIPYPAAFAIKIVIDRPIVAGSPPTARSSRAQSWSSNYDRRRSARRREARTRHAAARARRIRSARLRHSRAGAAGRPRARTPYNWLRHGLDRSRPVLSRLRSTRDIRACGSFRPPDEQACLMQH